MPKVGEQVSSIVLLPNVSSFDVTQDLSSATHDAISVVVKVTRTRRDGKYEQQSLH